MWKHIRKALVIAGVVGSGVLWASTNSIKDTVEGADGYIAENLRYIGWDNPPAALATTSADNFATVAATVLIILGVLAAASWGLEGLMKNKSVLPGLPGRTSDSSIVLTNVKLKNSVGSGLVVRGDVNLQLDNVESHNNLGDGFYFDKNANIKGNNLRARDNQGNGISVGESEDKN